MNFRVHSSVFAPDGNKKTPDLEMNKNLSMYDYLKLAMRKNNIIVYERAAKGKGKGKGKDEGKGKGKSKHKDRGSF